MPGSNQTGAQQGGKNYTVCCLMSLDVHSVTWGPQWRICGAQRPVRSPRGVTLSFFFWRTPWGLAVVGGGSGAGEDRARAGRRTAYEARLSFEACGREGCLACGVECEEHGRPQDAYGAQCVDWSSELRCARALAKAGGIWLVFRIPEKSAWSKTSHSVDGVNVCV